MARIELNLAHSYHARPQADTDYALLPLRMTFEDGGAYALLGPSGCGKTTLLNIVSGLLVPSQGGLAFDGRDVTRESPQQRNIAQVFQFPVIYDTMTVYDNLAFPLRNRGVPEADVDRRWRTEQGLDEVPEVGLAARGRVARPVGIGDRFVRHAHAGGVAQQAALPVDELRLDRVVRRQECEHAVVRVHAMHPEVVPSDQRLVVRAAAPDGAAGERDAEHHPQDPDLHWHGPPASWAQR